MPPWRKTVRPGCGKDLTAPTRMFQQPKQSARLSKRNAPVPRRFCGARSRSTNLGGRRISRARHLAEKLTGIRPIISMIPVTMSMPAGHPTVRRVGPTVAWRCLMTQRRKHTTSRPPPGGQYILRMDGRSGSDPIISDWEYSYHQAGKHNVIWPHASNDDWLISANEHVSETTVGFADGHAQVHRHQNSLAHGVPLSSSTWDGEWIVHSANGQTWFY